MSCFPQTCTQTVTGRNFDYNQALRNIQSESYLNEIDSDFLRRRYHYASILEQIDTFEDNYVLKRFRRQNEGNEPIPAPVTTATTTSSPSTSEPLIEKMADNMPDMNMMAATVTTAAVVMALMMPPPR